MKIAIIGAGSVGSTLGAAWVRKGHDIFFGVRHPQDDKSRQLVQSIGPKAQAGTVAEAAAFGEVVVLATPWQGTEAAIRAAGGLRGKVVIDCTNPLKPDVSGLDLGFTTSGAERVAQWAEGAKVFKAFNTTGSNNMADPVINGIRTVMFVCGDDEAVKPVVMQLVSEIGFDTVDAGGLEQARLLEPWAMLWISLAFQGGLGRDFGFALLRRGKPNPTA
jgi:8-hydroxy-5-deazaflavin:NADPH oxidoreductase